MSRANVTVTAVLTILVGWNTGCAQQRAKVMTGIDMLVANDFKALAGKRVGLITNPTGVTADLRSTVDVLHKAPNVELVALFGPEHGVRGDVTAGGTVADTRDPVSGVPAYSLYGTTRRPTAEMLKNIDVLVYDIQDNGSRSYTFISTMGEAMAAAAEHGIPFMVLDRPDPLTGDRVEGRPLDKKYKSFVGAYPIPYVYGMTCGELARMINGEGWLGDGVKCQLQVIKMRGWKRDMWFDETGLPWVIASPHVPHAESSAFYAATGIMGELRVLSEGVGYTLPFELIGAPWIEPEAFCKDLNARDVAGVRFRPLYFRPYYGPFKEKPCGGAQIYLTDRDQALLTGIQFQAMDVVRSRYPDQKLFGGKRDSVFDKVCGTEHIREMFQQGKPIAEIIAYWNGGLDEFMKLRAEYLLYD